MKLEKDCYEDVFRINTEIYVRKDFQIRKSFLKQL